MAVYQNSTANLGVKLEITHASPDIANNRTTITYKASVYKTGSHNPWNLLSSTPQYLTINGQPLHSTATGNYDLRGGTYEQVIKSGTLVVPHNSDGTKSFSFSWNVNFTNTGYGYGNVTASGTYTLPTIARASTFTIPSTTITTGSAFTVTINKASDGFRHKVAYIVGSSVNEWITNADTTYSATIPHSLFNSHKSTASVSGVIRVTTMNGSVEVGSNQRTVTINLTASAKPTLASVSYTNSNKGMFSGTNQFIRNVSLPTITAGTATGSYSSTISSYEFQTLRNTSTVLETISKTANSQQFGAFNFPASGSEAKVYMQARVRDSRGRYSGWVKTPELRVHHYAPPAIGTMTVKRTGSGNTTLQVNRNYVVTNMFEGGGTTNSNTASLSFQHRTKGTTAATNNTGAKSTTMYLTNSNANLAGTFATNTSYEVRAILSDKLNTVYGSWISVGTEFVPMDIGPKGIGVGKVHSNGSADLEVGSGGISSEGPLRATTFDVIDSRNSNPNPYTAGMSNRGLSIHFKSSSTIGVPDKSTYSTLFDIQPWMDTSGGNHQQIAINSQGDVYGRLGATSWSAWRKFVTEYADGRVMINGAPNGSTITIGSYNSTWVHFVSNGSPFHFNRPVHIQGHAYAADANGNGYTTRLARVDEIPTGIPKITSGTNGNGNWYNINGVLLICWYRFSITNRLTASQMSGTWTYPMPFAFAPAVSIGSRADSDPSSTAGYRRAGSTAFHQYNESATKTDILYAVNNGDVPSSPQKFLNIFAMGTPA